MKIYLDTHVVIWLAQAKNTLIKPAVQQMLETSNVLISPIVSLELSLMEEIGRVTSAMEMINILQSNIGLALCDLPFTAVMEAARPLVWTRDPFDRIIAAQAAVRKAPLITKDRHIRKHYPHAIW